MSNMPKLKPVLILVVVRELFIDNTCCYVEQIYPKKLTPNLKEILESQNIELNLVFSKEEIRNWKNVRVVYATGI